MNVLLSCVHSSTEMKEACTRGLPLTDELLCLKTLSRSIRFVEGPLFSGWISLIGALFLGVWAV